MLRDLTFEMCVPSLRCNEAHRMHKKTPRFQLAHAGFFAPQSAHCEFPGSDRTCCSSRSFRACVLLLIEEAILRCAAWLRPWGENEDGTIDIRSGEWTR